LEEACKKRVIDKLTSKKEGMVCKAAAINGSPRMEKGNTALVLDSFIRGMADAGSEIEIFYPSRLKIKPCVCSKMYCWYQSPGECCVKDEMQPLYNKLKAVETLILATPVYIPLPGDMQNFINRLCPLLRPYLETRAGRTRAHFHDDVAIQRIVLVSTGGWWEKENLDTVVRIAQELAEDASVEFAGALLRPHAFLIRQDGQLTEAGEAVLQASRRAGYELVKTGLMQPDTLEAVSRPLISEEGLRDMYNQWLL
jgi:multimeric flavodoxin WrbA